MSRYSALKGEHAGVRIVGHLGPFALCAERFEPATLHHHQYFLCRRGQLTQAMAARRSRRVFTG
jgi:hypothetical protein